MTTPLPVGSSCTAAINDRPTQNLALRALTQVPGVGDGAGAGVVSAGVGEGAATGELSGLGEGDGLAFAVLRFVLA